MRTFDPRHLDSTTHLLMWLNAAPGAFNVWDLAPDFEERELLISKLEAMVHMGILERHGNRRGWYIKSESELVEQDYVNADAEPVDIWLPFGLSDYTNLYSGSVVIIAGVPNMGKSCLIYNMIKENRHKGWDQFLFNSESDTGELKGRLEKFPELSLDQWGFKAFERYEDFHQVIKPGKNSINYVDFLELHDEFYKVGGLLKKIHNKLDGGIAVVALQKNPGSDAGLGGYRTLEVARLAINIEFQKAKVVKAKSPRQPDFNPNGRYCDFKIHDGYKIVSPGNRWYLERAE